MIEFVFYKTNTEGKMFSFRKSFANKVTAEMWANNTNHILMGEFVEEIEPSQETKTKHNLK